MMYVHVKNYRPVDFWYIFQVGRRQKWPPVGHFESGEIGVYELFLGFIVIHIPAKYKHHTTYG